MATTTTGSAHLVSQSSIVWRSLVGQERVREMLGAAFASGSLGHAYLFCGEQGVGKFAAAIDLARALLCTGGAAVPCGSCDACRKAARNAHPDLHVVVPVFLDKEHKSADGSLSVAGWEYLAETVRGRIASPYRRPASEGVPGIPVEWIKETNRAVLRGPVEGGRTVAIIEGIDLMNKESANAMLKTLEEPPQNTFLILTTAMPQSVLPTIASRCQIVRFGLVPADTIREAIAGERPQAEPSAFRRAATHAMGSVSRGLALAAAEPDGESAESRDFFDACLRGDWPAVCRRVDANSRTDGFDAHARFFNDLMYLVRNGFLKKEGCSETYIDENEGAVFSRLPADVGRVSRLAAACQDALGALSANANPGIVYVNFAFTVMELCDVEQQQTG